MALRGLLAGCHSEGSTQIIDPKERALMCCTRPHRKTSKLVRPPTTFKVLRVQAEWSVRPALPCPLPAWVELWDGGGPSMIRTICNIIWVTSTHLVEGGEQQSIVNKPQGARVWWWCFGMRLGRSTSRPVGRCGFVLACSPHLFI